MSDQGNKNGFLKDKLENYQVNPPDKVWATISSQLGGRGKNRLLIVVLATAASIALAVTLGITFFGSDLPGSGQVSEELQETSPQAQQPDGQDVRTGNDSGDVNTTLEEKVRNVMEEMEEQHGPGLHDTMQGTVVADQPELPLSETASTGAGETEPPLSDTAATDEKEAALVEPPEEPSIEPLREKPGVPSNEMNPGGGLIPAGDPLAGLDHTVKRDSRWMIGASITPLYSFRDAENVVAAGTLDYESGLVAYSSGVQVSYRHASRLTIESGLFYNKMGIDIGAQGIQLFNQDFDFAPLAAEAGRSEVISVVNSVGNIVAASGEIFVNRYKLNAASSPYTGADQDWNYIENTGQGIREHLEYLEVPFNLRYTVLDRKFELQLVGGMSTNFLVNNSVTMESAGETTEIGYLTNIRSVNYSGNAGMGMIYHIHEKFSLLMEPRFRYFLNSVNDETLPATRPYSLGFYTGLSYTF